MFTALHRAISAQTTKSISSTNPRRSFTPNSRPGNSTEPSSSSIPTRPSSHNIEDSRTTSIQDPKQSGIKVVYVQPVAPFATLLVCLYAVGVGIGWHILAMDRSLMMQHARYMMEKDEEEARKHAVAVAVEETRAKGDGKTKSVYDEP